MNNLKNIKKDFDNYENYSKEALISSLRKVLMHEKKLDSKVLSLKNENNYYKRQLKNIENLIKKVLTARNEYDDEWK